MPFPACVHTICEDVLTKNVREAIDNGDFNSVRALLANASEMDKDRVLLEPYGESGNGLHNGTNPLLPAATCIQPEIFKELVQASPHDKVTLAFILRHM